MNHHNFRYQNIEIVTLQPIAMKNLVGNVDTAPNFPDSEMESEFGLKHKDGDETNPSFSTDVSDEEGTIRRQCGFLRSSYL